MWVGFEHDGEGQVLSAIERLPEDADFKDLKDDVAFLAAIQEADNNIAAGRTITNEEMRRRIGHKAPIGYVQARRAGIFVAVDDLPHPKNPSGAASGVIPPR